MKKGKKANWRSTWKKRQAKLADARERRQAKKGEQIVSKFEAQFEEVPNPKKTIVPAPKYQLRREGVTTPAGADDKTILSLQKRLKGNSPILNRDLVAFMNICDVHAEMKLPRSVAEAKEWKEMAKDLVYKYRPIIDRILYGAK